MNREISFEEFYKIHYSDMMSYCCSRFEIGNHNAEDIVQKAFLQLLEQWNSLDTHTEKGLFIWTRKTVKYMSFSFNRNNARMPVFIPLEEWIALEEWKYDSAKMYIAEEERTNEQQYHKYLDKIRQRLTDKELLLFECIIVQHNNVQSAAKILRMKENSVKVSLRRLRAKLKKDILPNIFE